MGVTPETHSAIMNLYGYCCAECMSPLNVELHHKLPRSKSRTKLYPLFIDSPMNLIPLCGGMSNNCHSNHKIKYKIGEQEAQIYETYLESLKEN